MTIHYHGLPITPRAELLTHMAGRHFCVSFKDPRDVAVAHQIGQSVMLDNGAFSYWKEGKGLQPYGEWYNDRDHFRGYRGTGLYSRYVEWAAEWCDHRSTWCIIPDAIDAGAEENEQLLSLWPLKTISKSQAAPVWHLDESIDRLQFLIVKGWPRICIGSAGRFATVGNDAWRRRMDVVFNRISDPSGRVPVWLHMLRGMQLSDGWGYPFASVDSTDVARNHNVKGNMRAMADRWDKMQCPARWHQKMEQVDMIEDAAIYQEAT
jgi:hypothetical protein